jgi:hypothetical protein
MGRSLQLMRNSLGEVAYLGELPETIELSNRYVEGGGIPGVLAERAVLEAELEAAKAAGDDEQAKTVRAALKAQNPTPMFDRDGMDLIYHFTTGDRRYRFVGFDTIPGTDPPVANPGSLRYELEA